MPPAGDTEPQAAVRARQHALRTHVADRIGARFAHSYYGLGMGVIQAHGVGRGDKHQAAPFTVQGVDVVIVKAVGRAEMAADPARGASGRVDGDDAGALGANPNFIGAHFNHGDHALVLKRRLRAAFLHGAHRAAALFHDEGTVVARRCPDTAGAVLIQPADGDGRSGIDVQRDRLHYQAACHAAKQALAGAEPEIAFAVAQQGIDAAFGQIGSCDRACFGRALGQRAGGANMVKSAAGADPDPAGAVIGKTGHTDVAHAVRPGAIACKAVVAGVVTRQAT